MNSHDVPSNERLTEEAVYWVSKLHSKKVSHKEKVAFSKWLNKSHLHERTFDEINATWVRLGSAQFLPEIQAQAAKFAGTPKKKRLSRAAFYSLQVISLALLMFGGVLYYSVYQNLGDSVQASPVVVQNWSYETSAGENELIHLPDGSSIHLNTRTKLSVKYSESKRLITLKRGEAYFDVASDKSRPFIVKLGDSSVTAVGTAFNIFHQASQSTVTITEGVVQIKGKGDKDASGMRVKANRKVKIVHDSIQSIEDTSTLDEVLWQDKQLVFRSEPLNSVFKELNRYLEKTIVIQDPSLKSLRLTGTFDVSNPEKIVLALKESYELEESIEQGYRFIRRRHL